jgi:hypothetical protein
VKEGRGSAHNTDARYGIGTTEYMLRRWLRRHPRVRPARGSVIARGSSRIRTRSRPGSRRIPCPRRSRTKRYGCTRWIDRGTEDRFEREWASFDPLEPGDVIATRHDGKAVTAERRGRILFPDVKAMPGHEWFYLAESIAEI